MSEGLIITNIGGYCPCQAEGFMDGFPFYFRARHGDWQLDVVSVGGDAVSASLDWSPCVYRAEGDDPTSGYMEPTAAGAILGEHYVKFCTMLSGSGEATPKTGGLAKAKD